MPSCEGAGFSHDSPGGDSRGGSIQRGEPGARQQDGNMTLQQSDNLLFLWFFLSLLFLPHSFGSSPVPGAAVSSAAGRAEGWLLSSLEAP